MENKDKDNNISMVTNILKTTKETLPKTTNSIDELGSSIFDFCNSVLLYQLKKYTKKYKNKLKSFDEDLDNNLMKIPKEYQKPIDVRLLGNVWENLKYSLEEDDIRKMFLNLLTSAADSRKKTVIHPSYVQIISKMDSFDANLFKILVSKEAIQAINPQIIIKNSGELYENVLPEWFILLDGTMDIFQVSASLIRLSKFGIIDLLNNTIGDSSECDFLVNSHIIKKILKNCQEESPNKEIDMVVGYGLVKVNDYGKQFADVCL